MVEITVGIAEDVPDLRFLWIDAQRLPVGLNRLVSLLEMTVGKTEDGPGNRILWINA